MMTETQPVAGAVEARHARETASPRAVAFHSCHDAGRPAGHDRQTKMAVARSIAELLGATFVGELDPLNPPTEELLIVPSDTIEGLGQARRLGIERSEHLFGGVVPHPFVATKAITHPLVHAGAAAPAGWSAAFGAAVQAVVLPGFSAFSAADALLAGQRLLGDGAVRLKMPDGVGGAGQQVVRHMHELEAGIAAIAPQALADRGLVLEANLDDVTTQSVGQVRIGPWIATYCGTQQLTRNHRDEPVYGGSSLVVVRGNYAQLLELALTDAQRTAVEQALVYDRAAFACFPGLMASRCNYDVAQGRDDAGHWRSGVLEQSWRIGGASGAEVAALHAFAADPSLQVIRASTHEVYGEHGETPLAARVHYDGVDPLVGRLTKYAMVEPYGLV